MKFTLKSKRNDRGWPGYILWGRIRTSTAALVVVFILLSWTYQTFAPAPESPAPAGNQVVPPGFVPDPEYTWVPRTNVQEPTTRRTYTTTTEPTTTSPTETTETTSTDPSDTSPTSPTSSSTAPTTVVDPDGAGPASPTTVTDPNAPQSTPPTIGVIPTLPNLLPAPIRSSR